MSLSRFKAFSPSKEDVSIHAVPLAFEVDSIIISHRNASFFLLIIYENKGILY